MFKPTGRISILYFFIDAATMFFCFFVPYFLAFNLASLRGIDPAGLNFPCPGEYVLIYGMWGVLIFASLQSKKLYSTDRTLTIPREIFLVGLSVFYVSLFVLAGLFFIGSDLAEHGIFIWNFLSLCVFLALWRTVKRLLIRYLVVNGFNNFNVLILGANAKAGELIEEINDRPYLGLKVAGILDDSVPPGGAACGNPVLGKISDFEKICKKHFIEEIFITSPLGEKASSHIVHTAKKMHIGVRIVPQAGGIENTVGSLGTVAFLTINERRAHPSEFFLKRALDIFIAVPSFFVLLPFMAVIAFLIRIDSPGPVLYAQKRTGRKGKVFDLYKFRSMVRNADELKRDLLRSNEVPGGVIFKMRNDPRVTRTGKFLRRHSLDELPQLINVIKGDLSLVGPRPFPVDESERMAFHHMPRLNIRPGLTGLAQVRGRSNLSFHQWARLDLWYMRNWSLGLDLKILLWTVPAVFRNKGAY